MAPQLAFTVFLLFNAAFATNEAGNETVSVLDDLSKKTQDRLSKYQTSIKYWDTTNPEAQQAILNQLAEAFETEEKVLGCPRIRFPIICDNDGAILENVCYFRMKRWEKQGILPVLVFTSTPIEQARALCDKETRRP